MLHKIETIMSFFSSYKDSIDNTFAYKFSPEYSSLNKSENDINLTMMSRANARSRFLNVTFYPDKIVIHQDDRDCTAQEINNHYTLTLSGTSDARKYLGICQNKRTEAVRKITETEWANLLTTLYECILSIQKQIIAHTFTQKWMDCREICRGKGVIEEGTIRQTIFEELISSFRGFLELYASRLLTEDEKVKFSVDLSICIWDIEAFSQEKKTENIEILLKEMQRIMSAIVPPRPSQEKDQRPSSPGRNSVFAHEDKQSEGLEQKKNKEAKGEAEVPSATTATTTTPSPSSNRQEPSAGCNLM